MNFSSFFNSVTDTIVNNTSDNKFTSFHSIVSITDPPTNHKNKTSKNTRTNPADKMKQDLSFSQYTR
jgi:hypothetical protein